jgi:HPt (histidine-containing phosphotransfer) domain-containing protein
MLALFTTHGKPLLEELQQKLLTDQPPSALERPAHKLKGMANNIGAVRLAALCDRIQDDPAAGTLPLREQYHQELEITGRELFATLEKLDWQALREQFSGG